MPLRTLSGIAEKAGANIRTVLDYNPEALPFKMPPQIGKGLETARGVSDQFGLEINIPTADDIQNEALTRYQGLIGDLRRPVEGTLKNALGFTKDATRVIESLDWLIG